MGPYPRQQHHQTLVTALMMLLAVDQTNAQQQTINPSSHQTFADALTPLLYKTPNECSSALGISLAFSLIYPGCTNDAIAEIKETLYYPDGTNMQLVWEETIERMIDAASGECIGGVSSWNGGCYSEAPVLKIANSVWFDNRDTLDANYESVVGDFALQTNFTSPTSPLEVNGWVSNSTNGLIEEIVDPTKPLFPSDVLIALNSIYLKARWAEQFSEHATNLDTFYGSAARDSDNKVSEAHFMHTVEYFEYSHDALAGYQVIDLKFEESSMSMVFVLPMVDMDDDDEKMVSSLDVIAALNGDEMESTRVALSLPKFKFESEYKDGLKEVLQELGIKSPFMEGSEALCGIFDNEEYCDSLIISKVIQKTLIDVNEKGVEAAAVTAIGVSLTSAGPPPPVPTLMVLDHPFQFFIYDKTEGLMLFEGRVGAPEAPDTEPEKPLLDAKHEDEEFWSKIFFVDPITPQPSVASVTAATGLQATTTGLSVCQTGQAADEADGCQTEGQFCRLDMGVCTEKSLIHFGVCDATSNYEVCATNFLPVCGCDGVTYSNECTAYGAMTSVSRMGRCDESPPISTTAATATTVTDSTIATSSEVEGIVPLPAAINPSNHQEFADDLVSIIYTKDNECSSALGVSMAFSLIYPGCDGDSIDQIRETLHYPEGTNMQLVWEATTQSMLSSSTGDGKPGSDTPLLKIANSVWFDDGEKLNADYEDVVGDYAMQTDFKDDESPYVVNEWVEESTNGLIKSIVPTDEPLFPPYVLIAINSIYLKARWQEQFSESKTNLDSFYNSASRSTVVSEAHFMNMVEHFSYSDTVLPGYQLVDLPFASSQISMVFALPVSNDNSGVAISSTALLSVLSGLENTHLALSLPKFKFESTYEDLADSLKELGIEDPFIEGTGALCGIFKDTKDCEKLVVDKVVQKTVIDLNEKGVEAAAVTAISVGFTSIGLPPPDPILMLLDHPFQFFIYDKSQELMLFEGRVGMPEVPDAEPAVALLDAKHSDPDFWLNEFNFNVVELAASDTTTTVATSTVAATSQASIISLSTSGATAVPQITSATSAAATTTAPEITAATSVAATTAITSGPSSSSEATPVPESTNAASTAATTPVNSSSDVTMTTSTSSSAPNIPEPEPILESSSRNKSIERFAAICTTAFSAFALAYVL